MTTKPAELIRQALFEIERCPAGRERECLERVRRTLDGVCPDSGYAFEQCVDRVCDCGYEGGVPWA